MAATRKNVHLVCSGKYHDFDFARLELLKLLSEIDHVRVTISADYSARIAIEQADALITYTSDVIPDEHETSTLEGFLRGGGRWFALHGTNAVLRYQKGTGWIAPKQSDRFFEMVGSQFVAHPPIQPFTVKTSQSHPLVDGIEPFEADDEIYLCDFFGEHECLMETSFSGEAPGFEVSDWSNNDRVPVMYLHPWEDNEILYLNLGHARGHHDMQPLMEYYPEEERGSWKQPAFYELLRRGISWSIKELEEHHV